MSGCTGKYKTELYYIKSNNSKVLMRTASIWNTEKDTSNHKEFRMKISGIGSVAHS